VGNESSNDVSVIEAPTNTVVATVPGIQHADVGAITPNGAYVYVASGSPPNVFVIDTATNAVVATIPIAGPADTGANDVAVTPDGTKAYAPNATEVPGSVPGKTVSVIDTATNALVETVTVGNGAASVAITPDGAYAYVTNYADHTVSVLATATNTVVATVPIPGCAPWPPTQCANDIAITPNGAFAYVTNLDVNNVSVIDTATNTVVATIPVGIHPDGIAITPDGAFAYVANESSATVSVIDLATNSVSATISVVGMPVFVAVSPDGGAAYVSSFVSNVVSVIDTLTNTVTATVPVGSNPGRLAVASVPGACSVAGCGNGTIGPGEECDDGNTEGGDCCSSSCQFESSAVQCRPSVGACDPAEFCTGTAGTCPPDANPTCTPTPTPIPNPCAAGADTDGDGVANACDNCPDDFNPAQSDGNGNGAGDVCDGTSSALVLKRVQLKAASANKSNASIRIRALLDAADFGALDAALAGGLVVAVSGAGLTGNEVMTFPVPRCIALTSSRISCIGSNGETATFVKHRKGSLFNVRITAKSRTFLPPLSPTGVQVVFSAGGLDRADKIPSCKVPASGRSANCRK
jgi:YVTN family beta-propeller protein/cysteine-rich repeat protein